MKNARAINYQDRYCISTEVLMAIQLILVLCESLGWEPTFVITVRSWLQSTSIFLTIMNLLVIAYQFYVMQRASVNGTPNYRLINIGVCIVNIVLVNELYKNSRLAELIADMARWGANAWTSVSSFIEGRSFGGFLVLAVIIAAIIATVFSLRKKVSPEQQTVQPQIEQSQTEQSQTEQPQTEQPQTEQPQTKDTKTTQPHMASTKDTSFTTGSMVLFVFLYVLFLLLAIILLWYIVKHFGFINQISESIDYVALFQIIIIGLAILIAVPVVLMLAVRYVVAFFTNLPAYFSSKTLEMDNIIRAAIILIVAPVLLFISSKFQIEDFIDLDSNKLLIVLPPFIILVYFFVAYIIVELIFGILSGQSSEFISALKGAADQFGKNLVKYCDGIIKLLGTLLKILPDFLTCLFILLFDEDEHEKPTTPECKPKDRNNTSANNSNGKGD